MKYFSMFSGIGGFELGIIRSIQQKENQRGNSNNSKNKPLKWECVGYSEIDKYAIETYKRHFPNHKNYGSATDINPEELPDFDMLCGGFPCQAFSIAGQRMGFEDTRGTLFFEIARIAKAKRPQIIFVENVKGLLSHDNGRTFATIIATLDELGYNAEWQVLNSKHFGVPQNRERVFIIGHLRGSSSKQIFPLRGSSEEDRGMEQTKEIIYAQKADREIARIYDPDGIAPTLHLKTGGWQEPKIVHPTIDANYYKGYSKQRKMIVAMRGRNPENTSDRTVGAPTKQRLEPNSEGISNALTSVQKDNLVYAVDLYNKKLHSDRTPALTEPHHNSLRLIENKKIRRLTPTECERLQGFPDGWTEGVSDTQRYKQLGNAVTVNVIEAIAKNL